MHKPGRRSTTALLSATLLLGAVACSSDDDTSTDGGSGEEASSGEGSGGDCAVRLGYSAWPGWFPWAVTEEAGIFEENGVDAPDHEIRVGMHVIVVRHRGDAVVALGAQKNLVGDRAAERGDPPASEVGERAEA